MVDYKAKASNTTPTSQYKMKPVTIDKKNEKVIIIRAECGADEGRKHLEKVELNTHDIDTVKYVEKKLVGKGVGRLERRPADGLPLKHEPKKGHGGKYTWEGPLREEHYLEAEPPAIDDGDPNYVAAEEEDAAGGGSDELVVGEVEVAKAAEEGVSRIEVHNYLA